MPEQDPDEDWGSEYSARVRLIRDLAAAGIPMDHFGGCKFGQSEAATAKLPSAQASALAPSCMHAWQLLQASCQRRYLMPSGSLAYQGHCQLAMAWSR